MMPTKYERLLCFFGLHDWRYDILVDMAGVSDFRECRRCPRHHVELIKLCLDKGGVPSVASGYRLERCDFPQEPARNAAESYCIEDKTTGKWYGPSFCAILERK